MFFTNSVTYQLDPSQSNDVCVNEKKRKKETIKEVTFEPIAQTIQ